MSYRRTIGLLAALLAIAGSLYFWLSDKEAGEYRTEVVERDDLLIAITATGTVEPEDLIDVGAQIAGKIVAFGTDKAGKSIDYGSEVEEGSVLARIDESLYQSDVTLAEASKAQAAADLEQARAEFQRAELEWHRAEKLGPSESLSASAFDQYKSNFQITKAQIAVAEARVKQADASLEKAQRNLEYCKITSPVTGVIIDRRVNIGQTVVSSLNAPSLFLIAKDLRRMQVWVSVNEADIGSIHPGQAVSFTVDALPGEVFHGEVAKVRLNATMVQNVVTYIVEVNTDNSSMRLLPYLTANVSFEVKRVSNTLVVPNAALRWKPGTPVGGKGTPELGKQSIYVLRGSRPHAVEVTVGVSDGIRTAVEGEELREQDLVVIGERESSAAGSTESRNPFTPSFPRGGGRMR